MIRRLFVLAPGIFLAGCGGVQSALDPASDQASSVFGIWTLMLWICGVMYALVLLFLALAIWKAALVPGVMEFAGALFFTKLVIYTFLYWLPFYLKDTGKCLLSLILSALNSTTPI